MAKELFIHVDYTDKNAVKFQVSNYFNQVAFTDTYDLDNVDFYEAMRLTISHYKSALLQQQQELLALHCKKK